MAGLGLPLPKTFAVPKNTLVIANTCGFHARGQVQGENINRLEIWVYARSNPFNPFVGFGIPLFKTLSEKIYKIYLERKDKLAAKRNSRSTWYKVNSGVAR